MRGLECELAFLNKSDGSSSFQQGTTKALCAVYGPAEVRANQEKVDKATLECIIKPKIGIGGVKERFLEDILWKTCEEITLATLHPRSAIQIVLQVIQDSGSLLACMLNAACMAMIHAGLPMKSMMVAISCALTDDGDIIVDPTNEEEKNGCATMTFVFDTKRFELITSHTTGKFFVDQYMKCLEICKASATEVSRFQRDSIVRFLNKESENMDDEEERTEDGEDDENME